MAFASLTIDLNARLANIEKDLGRSVHMAERSAQRMQSAFSGVGKAFAALGVAGAGAGLTAFVRRTIDAADEMAKLSMKTGLAVEDLAGWRHAVDQAGLDTGAFEKAVSKVNTAITQTPDKLRSIGVDGNNAHDVLLQLSDVFAGIQDPTRKAGLAVELFGERIGPDLLPLLSHGRAGLQSLITVGKELNPVTTDAAKAAERFNDALDTLGKRAGSIGSRLAMELVEPMADTADALDKLQAQYGVFTGSLAAFGAAVLPGVEADDLTEQARAMRQVNLALEEYGSRKRWSQSAIGELFPEYSANRIAEAKQRLDEAIRIQRDMQNESSKEVAAAAQQRLKILEGEERRLSTHAENIRTAFAKATEASIAGLEKLVSSFPAKRQQLEEEFRRLQASLTGSPVEGAKGFDIAAEIAAGNRALASGDQVGLNIATERATEMLRNLKSNGGITDELTYYTRTLKELKERALTAQQEVAVETLNNLYKDQSRLLQQASAADPMKLQLDGEYIGKQLAQAVDEAVTKLTQNGLQVPLTFVPTMNARSVDIGGALRDAALQTGGR